MPKIISPNTQFKKIITHPNFFKSLFELKRKKIKINYFPNHISASNYGEFPSFEGKVSFIDDNLVKRLNPENGANLVKNAYVIAAYDESIEKYDALEGSAYLTAHSLIYLSEKEYMPIVKIDFNFYTRSLDICEDTEYINYSENIEVSRSQDYVKIREEFIKENAKNFPKNTIIFIDGPLLGGNVSDSTTKLNEYLLNMEIIPIFIVKNSTSNLITDNLPQYTKKFNSDIHWSYELLSERERTGFIMYQDLTQDKWGKVFSYVKIFDNSPQRIEFHTSTYKKYGPKVMNDILDIITYLYLVQGDLKNLQIRPIVIAEQYARESIKIMNFKTMMKRIGLISTMNQERFG